MCTLQAKRLSKWERICHVHKFLAASVSVPAVTGFCFNALGTVLFGQEGVTGYRRAELKRQPSFPPGALRPTAGAVLGDRVWRRTGSGRC